jgi:hypothetical protein
MHKQENSMIGASLVRSPFELRPGTIVRVSHVLYHHVGLISDRFIGMERAVVAFSAAAGGLHELPFSAFQQGRDVFDDGYPGQLPPDEVLRRARLKHGQAYSWTEFNCEHFVRYAHGLSIESPQLKGWAVAIGLLGFAAIAAKKA